MKKYIVHFLRASPLIMKLVQLFIGNTFFLFSLVIKINPKLILLSSFVGKRFNDSPRVIYEKLKHDQCFEDYEIVWAFEDPSLFIDQGVKMVKLDSFKYFYTAFKAKIWLTNVNIERGLKFKKKDQIYINTWHCIPLKKMGNAVSGRLDYDFRNVDYLVYSGEYERQVFERDFNARPDSLVKSLMPRNDPLLKKHVQKGAVRRKFNISEDDKVILYAPTWRDSNDLGKTYKFNTAIDSKKWLDALPDHFIVLFRAHHFISDYSAIIFNDRFIDVSHFQNVTDLMLESDVLVSDYSSIIFDYALTEKPIFCFGPDYKEFSKSRGFYFDLDEEIPNGVIDCEDTLLELINKINWDDQKKFSRNFRKKFISTSSPGTELCINFIKKNMEYL